MKPTSHSRILGAVILALGLVTIHAMASEPKDHAKKLFSKLVALSEKFDPAVADLYSDKAKIENVRTYPNGEKRTMGMTAIQYKQLLRQVMPLAKARGDISTYSEVKYREKGDKVEITAKRFSKLKNYTSSYVLVVGEDLDTKGEWRILEERSESRP